MAPLPWADVAIWMLHSPQQNDEHITCKYTFKDFGLRGNETITDASGVPAMADITMPAKVVKQERNT